MGAGLGLPSLLCGRLGARSVILQDRPDDGPSGAFSPGEHHYEAYLREACQLNQLAYGEQGLSFLPNSWGEPMDPPPQVTLVLASDCFYDKTQYHALLATLYTLLSSTPSQATCLMVYHERNPHHSIRSLCDYWGLKAKEVSLSPSFLVSMVQKYSSILPSLLSDLYHLRLFVLSLT